MRFFSPCRTRLPWHRCPLCLRRVSLALIFTQISRVSAKKYLDFLCEQKVLQQTYVYGNKGRPANLYQVTADGRGKLQEWERD